MSGKLDKLGVEKKKKMIESLLDEFSSKGFERGSTNVIARNAGISKGSLFNYLGSKKEQYLYLLEYIIKLFTVKLGEIVAEMEKPADYFDMLKMRSEAKNRLAIEYNREYHVIFEAYQNPSKEVKEFVTQRFSAFTDEAIQKDRESLDPNQLKNPENRDLVYNLLFYFISGYTEAYFKRNPDISPEDAMKAVKEITSEIDKYFDLIKKAYFK